MERAFYIDNHEIDYCFECYFDAPHCPALKGLKYNAKYDCKSDCDNVYIHDYQITADDFKKTLQALSQNSSPMCNLGNQNPWQQKHLLTIIFPRGNPVCCQQSIRNGTENELCGCTIVEMMDKNNLPYHIVKQYGFGHDYVFVEESNKKLYDEKCWLFEPLYIRSMCIGCKWHPRRINGELAQYVSDKDVCKPYVQEQDCPSRKMLSNGYTPYEAHVKCLACSEAIKWQLKFRSKVYAL